MRERVPFLGCLALAALALWAILGLREPAAGARPADTGARYTTEPREADGGGLLLLGAGERRATLRFASGTHPVDRAAIERAIASARPEARRLIELVDGLASVRVGALDGRAVGLARESASGFEVELDLAAVSSRFGQRGINNVVLHELAHVLDFALVSDELLATVDARTPKGYGCEGGEGVAGAGGEIGCAPREERFADSFAKWATGDIGVDLYLGYQVPPPSGAWGEPLGQLGR